LQQKKDARLQFMRQKQMVQDKIKELRKQGRGIEEIYKYTRAMLVV